MINQKRSPAIELIFIADTCDVRAHHHHHHPWPDRRFASRLSQDTLAASALGSASAEPGRVLCQDLRCVRDVRIMRRGGRASPCSATSLGRQREEAGRSAAVRQPGTGEAASASASVRSCGAPADPVSCLHSIAFVSGVRNRQLVWHPFMRFQKSLPHPNHVICCVSCLVLGARPCDRTCARISLEVVGYRTRKVGGARPARHLPGWRRHPGVAARRSPRGSAARTPRLRRWGVRGCAGAVLAPAGPPQGAPLPRSSLGWGGPPPAPRRGGPPRPLLASRCRRGRPPKTSRPAPPCRRASPVAPSCMCAFDMHPSTQGRCSYPISNACKHACHSLEGEARGPNVQVRTRHSRHVTPCNCSPHLDVAPCSALM